MSRVVADAACTFCSCVCDDLSVSIEDNRIVRVEGACRIAEPRLLSHQAPVADQSLEPLVAKAAELLNAAGSPLFYGFARTAADDVRPVIQLAERLGAVLDISTKRKALTRAMQSVGLSTCSLGEARSRADLVVFWGVDPVETHPRLIERCFSSSDRRPWLIAVDSTRNRTAEVTDQFIPLESELDSLRALRLLLAGRSPRPGIFTRTSLEALRSLAERMKSCKYVVIFFGLSSANAGEIKRLEALFSLVVELNAFTRFAALPLASTDDVSEAESILLRQTGYPHAVDFSRGFPRHEPIEFDGPRMIERGETDCLVLVGRSAWGDLSEAAKRQSRSIPVILLDEYSAEPSKIEAKVEFTTATFGLHQSGSARRLDDVVIPLRILVESPLPSAGEIFTHLTNRLT